MKRKFIFILVCTLAVLNSNNLKASENNSKNNYFPIGVGLYLDGKIGINAAEIPDGYKNDILIGGPDFGIIGYMPLSEDGRTGAILEIGYTALPFSMKYSMFGNDLKAEYVFRYVTISPQFCLSGFTIGLDIGFHSKTTITVDGKSMTSDEFDDKIADQIYTAIKLGGMIPVLVNDLGQLNVVVRGSYTLGGLGEDKYPLHPAALSLGLNYIFNIKQ